MWETKVKDDYNKCYEQTLTKNFALKFFKCVGNLINRNALLCRFKLKLFMFSASTGQNYQAPASMTSIAHDSSLDTHYASQMDCMLQGSSR